MKIKEKFISLDHKSRLVLINSFYSLFIKSVNIGTSFITVPIVLSVLNNIEYGIWLTITSVLGWFALFDLGLGNGLRNHLTLALAKGNLEEAKIYVSTTYGVLSIVFLGILILFLCTYPFVNWVYVFNSPMILKRDVDYTILISVSLLCIQFVLRLINSVLLSLQKTAIVDFYNMIIQTVTLVMILLLKYFKVHSLLYFSVVYSVVPIVIFCVVTFYLFFGKYRFLKPSIKLINFKDVRKLFNLGVHFFIIQIAALVLYASNNFIITQLFSPADVTVYNIAYKYFSISNIIFSILLVPFWSMTTKAYAERDFKWIKSSMFRLFMILCIIICCSIIQLCFSNQVYSIWTNDKVIVPFYVSITMFIYFIFYNIGGLLGSFLNGTGKIKIQLFYSVFAMFINIPMALFFSKYLSLGVIGVPLATICTMLGANFLTYIQYKKIISDKAFGIWDS